MGIHLYLLSANPPTFVIVSHDLTDLYYQLANVGSNNLSLFQILETEM